MIRKAILFILFTLAAGLTGLVHTFDPFTYSQPLFFTLAWLAFLYLLFKIIAEKTLLHYISEAKNRYILKKITSILFFTFFTAITIGIWLEDIQSIVMALGLVSAAIAFSLQDLFRNIAGGLTLFIQRPFSIGDRIELAGKVGDVVDIGLMHTTIMEMREWVNGDQPTGRLTFIPNGSLINGPVNNYTKDQPYIWDEVDIPVTYGSNTDKARTLLLEVAKKETEEYAADADRKLRSLVEKYYLPQRSTDPMIFLELTDNWMSFHVRYTTLARERRNTRDALNTEIWKAFQKEKDIRIASSMFGSTDFSKR